MAFQMFTQLFDVIDTATKTYVTDISSKAIVAATPIVSVSLTIAFIVYGFLIMRGAIDMPLSGFLSRSLRISIITSIALTTGLYQSDIAKLIIETPNDLLNALINNAPDGKTLSQLLDETAQNGFDYANQSFEEAVYFNADSLLFSLFGILILLATSFLVAIGGAFILLAKIILILLVGLGPFFIISLLWQPTYRFFEQWITQILNYTILIVLLATVFSLMMRIFTHYTKNMKIEYSQNMGYTLGGAIILSIIFIVLLFKLSSVANALAKGVTFGHLWRSNATGNTISQHGRMTK